MPFLDWNLATNFYKKHNIIDLSYYFRGNRDT